VDHRAWYDQSAKAKCLKEIVDIDYVAAMGPPGGGRNPVTPRLLRHFNIVGVSSFARHVLLRIFGTIMDGHLTKQGLAGTLPATALKSAVAASVEVLMYAQQSLRPTPTKSHYLFNLRDLGRVV
jgi:dynein heavy chain